jgi:conjugal transfer pilus assembly protein TraF
MTTPSLDETLVHPVDQNARHVYYKEQHKKTMQRIMLLASEYGLFFFFRKNCSYCHHFAPIVKRFAQKYGWSVLPISLDGGTLHEFPNAKQNNGIAERLNISHVPALIALHPKTGQLIPLAYGLTSESEIENRVEMLTRVSGGLSPTGLVPTKLSLGGQK